MHKGERVRLRLTSVDVVHRFSIPKLGVDAGWVEPGKVQEIELVADRAGRYTYAWYGARTATGACVAFCR